MRRGHEHVVIIDDADNEVAEFAWARCEINGCTNLVCRGMSLSLCYPHGIEFGAFTKEEVDRDRNQRHIPAREDEPNG